MSNRIKSTIIIVLVIAAVSGFFWLANFFGSGEKTQSEKPLVICQPPASPKLQRGEQNAPPEQPSSAEATAGRQECFWTAHIHATVRIFKSGKEIPVKFEEGKLEGQHTHSQPNKLHWHGLIPVDPKTKEVTDWSMLEVQKIVTDFKLAQEGTPKFIVNNNKVDPSYIWKDGDTIEIRYE